MSGASFQELPLNSATMLGPHIPKELVGGGGSASEQGQGCV